MFEVTIYDWIGIKKFNAIELEMDLQFLKNCAEYRIKYTNFN